jgi:pimeloyl-ACP methyl ester carboxylesterase
MCQAPGGTRRRVPRRQVRRSRVGAHADVWPLGDIQQWIAASLAGDGRAASAAIDRLLRVAAADGLLPEAYDPDTGLWRARDWFAWPSAALGAVYLNDIDRDAPWRLPMGVGSMSSRCGKGLTTMKTTHTLETAEADIVYDLHGPLPTADGRPPLFMIGQPMDAGGFATLASYFPDRTVVTYDPRGLGRSSRKDGRVDNTPTLQADDVHAIIEALGAGPVEMFASSGGAVTALALVAAYPNDVSTLVAHEPPLIPVLPDAELAKRAQGGVRDAYQAKGSNAGMAAFIAMASWQGEFTEDFFARPAPDPAMFGMPSEDDGTRDNPLLSDRSWAITSYRPDVDKLAAAPTRIVIAVGEESSGVLTGRTAVAIAELLGQQATVFPSHHGGFAGAESGYPGQPEAFARKLRAVLDNDK